MAKPKTDRRRKRSPPSSEAPPSRSPITLLLCAGFLLSLLLSSNDDDPTMSRTDLDGNGQQQQQRQTMQRRFLLNEEERVLDVGVEENVWRRQLRARKDLLQQDPQRLNGNDGGRSMKVDSGLVDYNLMEDDSARPMRRMAVIPRYIDKHHFEECVGKTVLECQVLVDDYVTDHPEDFKNQTSLYLDIRKIRELTDESYYKVVIRTNLDGSLAYGILDDGEIYYPWPWRVDGVDKTIGPWDCAPDGAYMAVADCCAMIQEDVPDQNDYDKFLACFVEEPVGGPHNPERDNRAITVTDGAGIVVRAPVAH